VKYKWTQKNPRVFDSVSLTPSNKKAIIGEDQNAEFSSENHGEKAFLPSGISFNKEIAPKPSDWIERVNPDSKLPNFNTSKILEPESQAIKNMLGVTDESSLPESIKESESISQSPLPPLKVLKGVEPSSELTPLVYTQHSPRKKAGLGKTILKRSLTEASTTNDESTTSVSNEVITDSPDSKFDQLAELVRKLSEKIETSEKKTQPLEKEIKPASSSSAKSNGTSKPKMRCELCNYTTHTTYDYYRILFCMICKKDDHKTSDHLSYTVSSSVVSYHNAQSRNYASGSKQIRQNA
jgi:outer membrane murein-binding lipoprotein Lpp